MRTDWSFQGYEGILKYFVGAKILIGGRCYYNEELKVMSHETDYLYVHPGNFWNVLFLKMYYSYIPHFKFDKTKGIKIQIGNTFRIFYWKPYCPFWIDKDGNVIKSKRFQYLKFRINERSPQINMLTNRHQRKWPQ
jgi:hypothetical protein